MIFAQLNEAQPELIRALAEASGRRADQLEDLAMAARNTVRDRINDPDVWEGAAATAAYAHTADAVKTIFVLADCKRAVAAVQRRSGNEIDAAQIRLRNVAFRGPWKRV